MRLISLGNRTQTSEKPTKEIETMVSDHFEHLEDDAHENSTLHREFWLVVGIPSIARRGGEVDYLNTGLDKIAEQLPSNIMDPLYGKVWN